MATAAKKRFPRCGVTYLSQIEHEQTLANKLTVCAECHAIGLNKPLKRCSGCQLLDYCSKDCQKANWPMHKPFCNLANGKGEKNAYLSLFADDEVMQRVIDSYRLRTELDHRYREDNHGMYYSGKVPPGTVWANGDVVEDFQQYLDRVEEAGILPASWSFENRMQCLSMAIDEDEEENIFKQINQSELHSQYNGDMSIRYALLILAELVVGYDGIGPEQDEEWYNDFVEEVEAQPEEKAGFLNLASELTQQLTQQLLKDLKSGSSGQQKN